MASFEKRIDNCLASCLENFKINIKDIDHFDQDLVKNYNVKQLEECVQSLRLLLIDKSSMENEQIAKNVVKLTHAMECNIRSRPFKEQFPEIWESQQNIINLVQKVAETQESQVLQSKNQLEQSKLVLGWINHFDLHLEPLFTDLAEKWLKKSGINVKNVFKEELVGKKWSATEEYGDFELDGLLYCKEHNTFYMVESKYFLNDSQLEKTKETYKKFNTFLQSKRKSSNTPENRAFNRIWNWFFSEEDGYVTRDNLEVKVFLGVHSFDSDDIKEKAKKEVFKVIGMNEKTELYEVYE